MGLFSSRRPDCRPRFSGCLVFCFFYRRRRHSSVLEVTGFLD